MNTINPIELERKTIGKNIASLIEKRGENIELAINDVLNYAKFLQTQQPPQEPIKETLIKTFPLTDNLRRLYDLLSDLTEAKKIASKPHGYWWNKKINIKDLIEISKIHSEAYTDFWLTAFKEYPEIKGKDASSDIHKIKLT